MKIPKTLPINKFPHHLFWSYKPDAELPLPVLVKQVLSFGDIDDMRILMTLVSKSKLADILSEMPLNSKRIYFFKKIFLEL